MCLRVTGKVGYWCDTVISAVLIFGSLVEFRVPNISKLNNFDYNAIKCRKHNAILTDFGAVGDGKTHNTKEFNSSITKLSQYANDGGALLIVPPGKWLTGSFNLTSHFTLFLQKGAIILASQDEADWPQLPVLPSYGRGEQMHLLEDIIVSFLELISLML
ncbi:putative polygalacturonase [Trifolium repens]|nr:putative polygalacturonase [Trifolium repens]